MKNSKKGIFAIIALVFVAVLSLCCIPIKNIINQSFSKSNKTDNLADFLAFEESIVSLNQNNSQVKTTKFSEDFSESFGDVSDNVLSEEDLKIYCKQNNCYYLKTNFGYDVYSEFSLKRLIVCGNLKDSYGAEAVYSYNNISILSYSTEQATEKAYNELVKDTSLSVTIEKYQSVEGYANKDYNYSSYKNWGVKAADVGGYREYLSANNVTKEIVVVVLDTGINTSHEMFKNRLLRDSNGKVRGYSYFNSTYQYSYNSLAFDKDDSSTDINEADTNKYSFEDDNGHGTHVAGIICSLTPSNVKILPIKIGNPNSTSTIMMSAYLRVLNIYSNQYNVVCTNLSYSGGGKSNESDKNTFNSQVYGPLMEKNILSVTAAGNSSEELNIEDLKAVVVSALKQDTIGYTFDKSYSNYGKIVDVAAPGSSVNSSYIASSNVSDSDVYRSLSGTSMASPQVAGIVALLYLNPKLNNPTAKSIETLLYENCLDLGENGKDDNYGHGMVNLKFFEAEKTETLSFYKNNTVITEYCDYESFDTDFNLKIQCSNPNFKIIYTIDKSYPNLNNKLEYQSALNITDTVFIYAMGVKLVNDEIVERTSMYNISFFNLTTPIEDCFTITSYGLITGYIGKFNELVVPEKINNIKVQSIGNNVFKYNALTSITLPSTCTSISGAAFAFCSNLKYVYAPGVTTIYTSAFSDCDKLPFVTDRLPKSSDKEGVFLPNIIQMMSHTFIGCDGITSVSLSRLTTTSQNGGAHFADCTNLTSAYLPSLTKLPLQMFFGCTKLTGNFYIGPRVEEIGENPFYNTNITSFSVDTNNKNFYTDGYGVYSSGSLHTFAAGAKNINYEILDSVKINGIYKTIKNIAICAMAYTTFNTLTIPSSIEFIDNFGFAASNIETLNYNAKSIACEGYYDKVNNIRYQSFSNITNLNIGSSVKNVPERLFQNVKLQKVIINSINTDFDDNALYAYNYCNELYFEFTDTMSSSYISMIENNSGLFNYGVKTVYSRTEIPLEYSTKIKNNTNKTHDGNYYIYSKGAVTIRYTIKATAGEHGTISPSGTISLYSGESQSFTFSPDDGFQVSKILIDGTALKGSDLANAINYGYTFSNVTSSHTISVTFDTVTYKISIIQTDNGVISGGKNSYIYGENATFTITPLKGFHVEYLLIDNEKHTLSLNEYTFVNITENHTISACFAENEKIKYFVNHWQETLSKYGATYLNGKYYEIYEVEDTRTGAIDSLTDAKPMAYAGFTAKPISQKTILNNGNTIVDIYYDRNYYELTLVNGTGISALYGAGKFRYGEDINISADIKEGFTWDSWVSFNENVFAGTSSLNYTFKMPASNICLTATTKNISNEPEINVVFNTTQGLVTSSKSDISEGDNVVINITPNEGYEILYVLIDGINDEDAVKTGTYEFKNVTSSRSIHVVFTLIGYSISITINGGGIVEPSNSIIVEHGESKTITFTADDGYFLESLVVDGVEIDKEEIEKILTSGYTFENVIKNISVVATFKELSEKKFIVKCKTNTGGTLSCDLDLTEITHGDTRVIYITPNNGYIISKVYVNGSVVTLTNNTLVLSNITSDIQVEVVFEGELFSMGVASYAIIIAVVSLVTSLVLAIILIKTRK